MIKNINIKGCLPDISVIIGFVLISFVYFLNPVLEGKVLFRHDTLAGAGASKEIKDHKEQTGESTRWTNSLFGGMPTYQISPSYDSTNAIKFAEKVYQLHLPPYVVLTFIMLLGFFIMLRAFGVSPYLAGLGAVFWCFSSYFFILISAGHIWKLITLAYIPPTIAGMMFVYRGKYLLGAFLTALFTALQIMSNHIQMSYYFAFAMLFIVCAFFVDYHKSNNIKGFLKATSVIALSAFLGLMVNVSSIYHTYQYSKESTRGSSELVSIKANDTQLKGKSGGLSKEYITQWSYGIGETITLLVPNARGGASVPLSESEVAMSKADNTYMGLYSQVTQYFGEQPGTSGPVYVGAFVFFLFILGCFLVKGSMKWALLGATLFSIVLSWGKNFMPITNFFIDYVPLYNKFRAVSSILVVAEFAIAFLAILAVKEVIDRHSRGELQTREFRKAFYLSLGITSLGLLFAYFSASMGNGCISKYELSAISSSVPSEHVMPIVTNLSAMRKAIVDADVMRSLVFILIGLAILLSFYFNKINNKIFICGLFVLCLVDMWGVNKRYLNDSMFMDKSVEQSSFNLTNADRAILNDKEKSFRVLNMSTNTFNENNTSYWHKSVGGYHAAKLRRYQDIIDRYISPEMGYIHRQISEKGTADFSICKAINMLNTKYIILQTGRNDFMPIENHSRYGNAWFVENVKYVDNANEEIEQISANDLLHTAIVDSKFKQNIGSKTQFESDSLQYIRLTNQTSNTLTYDVSTKKDAVVVFSEVYYPGWECTIDGKKADIARADYILRSVFVPAGSKKIEMQFKPKSISITESIAYISTALILLLLAIYLFFEYKKSRK